MTNTNKFFQTKEQYLAFRAAFAAAHNDSRAKKGKADTYGVKTPGWLTAAHYMILNEVRGYPRRRGFSEITNTTKLANGMLPDLHINNAERELSFIIIDARNFIKNEPMELSSWEIPKKLFGIGLTDAKQKLIEEKTAKRQAKHKAKLDAFLAPFGDTFTITDLIRLGAHHE